MSAGAGRPVLEARGLVKGYRTAAGYIGVLQELDLSVQAGEMLAITGASGVGKSTLLHVLGTLDRPESGVVTLDGRDVCALREGELRALRNRALGFVFQRHHLLPEFSALENVMLPLLIARVPVAHARRSAEALLRELGLASRAAHRPAALSGGEQQRVAVARAVVRQPRLLLADEPTGNLDQDTGERLHALLRRLNTEKGVTAVVVTHNEGLAATCDRVLRMEAGRLMVARGSEGFSGCVRPSECEPLQPPRPEGQPEPVSG
jgi:lipoprotein-releasing system ATP-binding protein